MLRIQKDAKMTPSLLLPSFEIRNSPLSLITPVQTEVSLFWSPVVPPELTKDDNSNFLRPQLTSLRLGYRISGE